MMRAAATGEQREVWQQLGSTLDDHLTIKIVYNKIRIIKSWIIHIPPLVRSDKYFVSVSTCNPTACSHWLTQSQKEADIYYLFIIG